MSIIGLSSAAFEGDGTTCIKCQKLMTLFRSFFPAKSYALEQKNPSQDPEGLKKQILLEEPAMETILESYEDGERLEIEERGVKKSTYTVRDMGARLYQAGARALIAGIGHIDEGRALQVLETVLNEGLLSSKARFDAGLHITGASFEQDHVTGGAGHVFTRMLTESHLKSDKTTIKMLPYAGQIQLLFDLNATNAAGTAYAYDGDKYGTKTLDDYKNRASLIEFTKSLNESAANGIYHLNNEVMIKERIPPRYIKGVVVQSEKHRAQVIKALQSSEHAKSGKINGIPLYSFVQCQTKLRNLETAFCFRH